MYYPVPGHTHMMVHVPEAPASAKLLEDSTDSAALSPLIQVALDATFGLRDIKVLQERAFAPGVRAHARALRRHRREPDSTARVVSCHSSPGVGGGLEFCGTVVANNRRYGWVARVEGGQLAIFRVL